MNDSSPVRLASKEVGSLTEAIGNIADGSTVLIGGFGPAGLPTVLIQGLIESGARDLVVVSNNAGNGDIGLAALLKEKRARKIICSYPRQSDSYVFDSLYRSGELELELVPQGTLAERLRAGGTGIAAFYTPTGYGTTLADGKETRMFDDRGYVLEHGLRGDVALIRGGRADTIGNLTYRMTGRNFGPMMAAAATTTIAEVTDVVEVGQLDPETVVTPSIYVDRLLVTSSHIGATS